MDERLRVAIVSNYPLNHGRIQGGVRSVTQNLVRGLETYDDLEVHIIHCHSDVQDDRIAADGKAIVHYLARSKRRVVPNLVTGIGRIAGLLREINPDVVNGHSGPFALAGLLAGYPTVLTVHGVSRCHLWAVRGVFDHTRLFVDAVLETYAASRVKHIIAISPYILDAFRWAKQATFHRIDNPVSAALFSATERTVPGRILYAGSINEGKNVLALMRAMAEIGRLVPEAHLHVAGWVTSPRYKRQVDQFLAASSLSERISLRGFLETERLLGEFEEAAVLALPSKSETQPIAIIEAMAAGKPVVAANVGGVADIVEDGETGFVVAPGNEKALAGRLGQLLLDDELRRTMGERGRAKARERFSAQKAAKEYREVFFKVAGTAEVMAEGVKA